MKKSELIWLDNKLIPWKVATIHVATHTLHYGSGAFEGIRCYQTQRGPAIFRLSDHVDRLLHSFTCFNASIPWSKREIERAIIDTVKANKLSNCYIRPIIFFGDESLLINPAKSSIHCAIIAFDMEKYLGKNAINVGISSVKRIHPETVKVQSKVNGYYVNSIFACQEIKAQGFDEALLLDHENNIAEGTVANIFFVVDNKLKTPPTTAILPGITRATIITLAEKLGLTVEIIPISPEEIKYASEAFFCGTASEITPIKTINEFRLPYEIGHVTLKLKSAYDSVILGNDNEFSTWLKFINN